LPARSGLHGDSMHICFLCSEYPPGPHGGIGTFTRTLGRALAARGAEVTAIGIYPVVRETHENDLGVRVVRLPHSRVRGAGFFLNGLRLRNALRRLHETSPIDVLEGQENSLAMLPRRFIAPKTIRMHGGHHFFAVTLGRKPKPWRGWIEKRSFRRSDFRCGVSRFVVTKTCALLGMSPDGIEVIPNPIDTTLFAPRPGVAADGLVMFVGTVCEKKGVRQLMLAVPQILAAVPQAQVMVVGPDSIDESTGGSYTESMRRLLPAHAAPHVTFTGPIDNAQLPETMARATVCVYPSHMEALPIAFLEAMAMGKSVVASGAGPGPEVVDDGVSGLLCDPHDPASIAEQVTRVLTDPELARRLGERAQREVATRFSVEVLVDRNLDWYRGCMERFRPLRGQQRHSTRRTTRQS
jgi:glycosyltransferase involved in cell wall biosynthesis